MFRPCIDLHEGRVKQIVGSTLRDDDGAGPITNFVAEHDAGCSAGEGELDRAADYLERAYRAWLDRGLLPSARRDRLEPFERRALTRDLARVFDRLVAP